jgi:tripartite tricarboxylate transporter TctB family protein
MKSNSTMTIVMLAIFMVMVGIASGYPAGARFMTFVVGIPAIALCLLQLGLDVYRHRTIHAADARTDFGHAEQQAAALGLRVHSGHALESSTFSDTALDPGDRVRRELVVWGYFLALIAAILLLGFRVAIPLFLVAFLRFQAKATWRKALVLGIGAAVVLLLLFEKGLGVSLHTGFSTEYLLTPRGG